MSIIQKDLDSIRIRWNSHKIRATRRQECPPGKADVLYYLPDIHGVQDCKLPFNNNFSEMLHPLKREKNPFGCDRIFADAFRLLMTENNWQIPSTHDEALVLYCNLVAACLERISQE